MPTPLKQAHEIGLPVHMHLAVDMTHMRPGGIVRDAQLPGCLKQTMTRGEQLNEALLRRAQAVCGGEVSDRTQMSRPFHPW